MLYKAYKGLMPIVGLHQCKEGEPQVTHSCPLTYGCLNVYALRKCLMMLLCTLFRGVIDDD